MERDELKQLIAEVIQERETSAAAENDRAAFRAYILLFSGVILLGLIVLLWSLSGVELFAEPHTNASWSRIFFKGSLFLAGLGLLGIIVTILFSWRKPRKVGSAG